jgi:hypothetical protein
MENVIREKPYPSWTFEEETGCWWAPKPQPIDESNPYQSYSWNEEMQEWENYPITGSI